MMAARDKIVFGVKYGRVTVMADHPNNIKNTQRKIIGKCECGKEKKFALSKLKNGHTTSCGCYQKEIAGKNAIVKHGIADTPEYIVWSGMMARCYNKGSISYSNYGGKGIEVCLPWHDVLVFKKWLQSNNYDRKKRLQLDRKENEIGYSPENCRLVTQSANCRNKRNSKTWIVFGKQYDNLSEPAKIHGVCPQTVGYWCRNETKPNCYVKADSKT